MSLLNEVTFSIFGKKYQYVYLQADILIIQNLHFSI